MTTDKWKDKWVKSCEGMSNVTIVCNDGVVHSHKIIIAIVSEFIKDIMITIPVADDVTIFLPDFQTAHINSVIDQFIFGASHHSLNLDLQYVLKSSSMFKDNSEIPIECLMKKSEDLSEEIKQEREDEISFEEPLIQYNYEESEDSDYSPEKDIKTEDDLFCVKSSTLNDSRPASTSSGGGKEGLRRLAKQFLLNDEGSDSEEDDKSIIGGKKQKVKEKRRLYKQAIEAIASGDCPNLSKASKKFGINKGTLQKLMRSGQSYQGSGSCSKIFTKDEEKLIAVRILQNLKDGEALTKRLVEDILLQELEIVKKEHPERSRPANFGSFMWGFLKRNNLQDYYQCRTPTPGVKIKPSENQQRIQDLAKKFLLNDDEDFECDDMDKSVMGERKKTINEKRRKFRMAVEAIARGECKTISSAAKKSGVNKGTLQKVLESGQKFQGSGKSLRVFTREEEKIITERILTKSDGGKNLSMEIVSDILNEELSVMSINHPEKTLPNSALRCLKYNFCRRNNLEKLIQEKVEATRKDRRIYECEICYKKFTFKNSMVAHMRKNHSAFYRS